MVEDDITIQEIAHHRNGISGEPFAVVTFTWNDEGVARPMLGVLFANDRPERPGGFVNPRTAVLDRDRLRVGVIAFMENSWRGDDFDPFLRPAVNAVAHLDSEEED